MTELQEMLAAVGGLPVRFQYPEGGAWIETVGVVDRPDLQTSVFTSGDWQITLPAADIPDEDELAILLDGVAHWVREPRKIGDGMLVLATLTRRDRP